MSHLKGLSELEAVVNGPLVGEWPTRIGSLMMNFASIELISYQYLNVLEISRILFNINLNKTLSARIDRIIELIPRSAVIDEANHEQILDLWNTVLEMKDWRNLIAHNPLVYYWNESSNSEEDPLIG